MMVGNSTNTENSALAAHKLYPPRRFVKIFILASPTSPVSVFSPNTALTLNGVTDQLANLTGLDSPGTTPRAELIRLPNIVMDINMNDADMSQYQNAIDGPKTYNPPARGWTTDAVQRNHKDYVIKELTEHPDDCVAAVILSSDFVDRARGPAAIKATLMSNNIPDSDKIDILPAIPKKQVRGKRVDFPWTNIMTNCTAAFKAAVYANPVFHALHEGVPISFYCIPVQPTAAWIFAVYIGLTDDITDYELKSALFFKAIADGGILQLVTDDHSNIPGNHKPELVLAIAIHWGTVSKCTVHRGGRSITAHRIMLAPISKDPVANQKLQDRLMAPDFVIDAQKRGEATPWWGGNPAFPQRMSCYECHGIDHYDDHCPLMDSKEYRTVHGIPEAPDIDSSMPASLSMGPDPTPSASEWSSVPYRGGGRGRLRGGFRGRGGGYYSNYSSSSYNGGFNGGYNGGGRGRGGTFGRGNSFKPYPS